MPVAEQVGELVVSNELLSDPPKLRQRMARDGYIYIRGLGPKNGILDLRRAMLEVCRDAGWLDPKADLMDAKWNGQAGPYGEGDPEYMAQYKKVVNHPLFNELPADRFYMELMGKIVDGPVMMHRMHIGRITFPSNTTQTTPPHQDWQYIRGTPATYTVWTPVGDCPIELGGLKVLRGSHRHGYVDHELMPEQKYAGWGLFGKRLEDTGGEMWLTTGFTLGDCIVFHSHTVHGAMPNLTPDRLRLSTDNRYQREGDEFGPAAKRTHHDL
jgi:hypothetical protein